MLLWNHLWETSRQYRRRDEAEDRQAR